MSKAIVLLSGGLDSTTVLEITLDQGYEVSALTFKYGQRHDYEIDCAKELVAHFNIKNHFIMNIDLGSIGGSALTDDLDVPKDRDLDEMNSDIPITYVPARNTIFLSYALALAEVEGAFNIFIGVNALDYSGYPDCRPKYIEAFQKMGRLATKSGIEEEPKLQVHTPLIEMTKSEIIKAGTALDVDYSITDSCYDPISKSNPCGRCDACQLRLNGFMEAKMVDPLNYPEIQQ